MNFEEKVNKLIDEISDDLIKININHSALDKEINFEMVENYGKLSNGRKPIVFSKVNWSGNDRYDLRRWDAEVRTPYKGITFTKDELIKLKNNLAIYNYEISSEPIYNYENGPAKAKIYSIVCILSEMTTKDITWRKQVCAIDWGYGIKYDFRRWSSDYKKCSKGISISKEEMKELMRYLDKIMV